MSDIVAKGHDLETVKKVERLLYIAEYKRRQSAPGVKVTRKNFGRDRRYPIVNRFRDQGEVASKPDRGLLRTNGVPKVGRVVSRAPSLGVRGGPGRAARRSSHPELDTPHGARGLAIATARPLCHRFPMSKPIVRFAPSPTGRIHIGNARLALLNALFARREGGAFVLRFDDTDLARSKREYADAIEVDLAWLGIPPDVIVRQSERFALYDDAVARLRDMGRLYACYETAEELEFRRKRQLARGLPPIYDRAALEADAGRESASSRPKDAGRIGASCSSTATRSGTIWCAVHRHVDTSSLSDPVLVREDGTYLYTLPSVVDDIDLKITHVIRGEDHVTNTAVQIQIFEALGAKVPIFGHHNLLTTASGEGLSKRLGHLSLTSLREARARAAGGGVARGAGRFGGGGAAGCRSRRTRPSHRFRPYLPLAGEIRRAGAR